MNWVWPSIGHTDTIFLLISVNISNNCENIMPHCTLTKWVRIYVPQSLCSPISMFPVLCSPVSMFPGPMFPNIYVSHYLCSPVSMFPRLMFPSIYAPQYLCSPVPMFPSTYIPQYLCSPVPIFPIFHNKKLCDAESVISVIFTLLSVRMSVHPSKFSR